MRTGRGMRYFKRREKLVRIDYNINEDKSVGGMRVESRRDIVCD